MTLTKKPHDNDFYFIKSFRSDSQETYLDIGSNRGEAILSMLMMSNLDVKIIGFEPNPLIFNKLSKRYKRNKKITVHNFGLGDTNDEFVLYVPFYRKWMFDGLASFKYEAARDWLKSKLWRFNEKRLTIKNVKCETKRLDDLNLRPYFVKIDVQGFELEVLKGGIETIRVHTPILLIEAINEEQKDFLRDFGYEFHNFDKGELLEGEGRSNTFCITQDKLVQLDL